MLSLKMICFLRFQSKIGYFSWNWKLSWYNELYILKQVLYFQLLIWNESCNLQVGLSESFLWAINLSTEGKFDISRFMLDLCRVLRWGYNCWLRGFQARGHQAWGESASSAAGPGETTPHDSRAACPSSWQPRPPRPQSARGVGSCRTNRPRSETPTTTSSNPTSPGKGIQTRLMQLQTNLDLLWSYQAHHSW